MFSKIVGNNKITWFHLLTLEWKPIIIINFASFVLLSLSLNSYIPYARHHNPLLIRNRSWILTIHKARILRKKLLEKTFLDFKKWIKSIQTAALFGLYYITKRTRRIAANLALYAAFLVVKIIHIDHFLFLLSFQVILCN